VNVLDPEDEPRWLHFMRTGAEITLVVATGVLELADILDQHREYANATREHDPPRLMTWRRREEEGP